VGDPKASSDICEGFPCAVQGFDFRALILSEALASDADALFAEHVGDTSLGDTVASADLLSGFASCVALHDIGEVLDAQEAL
jgi:hypothetical protein